MIKLNCLFRNTAAYTKLQDAVKFLGFQLAADGNKPTVDKIYNILRDQDIEVDLQTVGQVYVETLPRDDGVFQSTEEVSEYVMSNYNEAIKRASELGPRTVDETLGEDKPELVIVQRILQMFTQANSPVLHTKSIHVQIQDALWKGVKRKLNIPKAIKPKSDKEWRPLLLRAFGFEDLGIEDLNGRLNGISDVFNAMRDELQTSLKDLQEQNPAVAAQYEAAIQSLLTASYSALLSQTEAKSTLVSLMKEAGFSKKQGDKDVLDWGKLAGDVGTVDDIRANVNRVLSAAGYSAQAIDSVGNSLAENFKDLRAEILDKAESNLNAREKAIGREVNVKPDIRRIAELYNLGLFNGAHDKVLDNLLGVSDIVAEDIADLEAISQAASALFREVDKNYGDQIFLAPEFQTLQRHIDNIIARNIRNKRKMLQIITWIRGFVDLHLTGMLLGVFTLFQNTFSGNLAVAAPWIQRRGAMSKEDIKVWKAMLRNVTATGLQYGEEIGGFAPRELFTHMLKFNPKENKAESLLYILNFPGRVGLLAMDSANKVGITNMTFKASMIEALINGGMSKEAATQFLNEALHGQAFEKAEEAARKVMEKRNAMLPVKFRTPITPAAVTRLANDMVKANLAADGVIPVDVIVSATKAAYHVAGYQLGHEANNWISSMIQGWRKNRKQREAELIKNKDWNQLVVHRFWDTFFNGFVIRFTAGATNWIRLTAEQQLGIGFATGGFGRWNKNIDFSNKKTLQAAIQDKYRARAQMSAAFLGAMWTLSFYLFSALIDDDEKEKEVERVNLTKELERLEKLTPVQFYMDKEDEIKELTPSNVGKKREEYMEAQKAKIKELEKNMYHKIDENYTLKRAFKKLAPSAYVARFFVETEGDWTVGTMEYLKTLTGVASSYSVDAKFTDALIFAKRGDKDAAYGALGSIIGGSVGVPMYRAYKDWYKTGKAVFGEEVTSDWDQPIGFWDGMLGGQFLEDVGIYTPDFRITFLPGIGFASYNRFKEHGIETMDDLKDRKDEWWNLKYTDKNGTERFIMDKADRESARKAAEEYFKKD